MDLLFLLKLMLNVLYFWLACSILGNVESSGYYNRIFDLSAFVKLKCLNICECPRVEMVVW